jgi:hypothetical protein
MLYGLWIIIMGIVAGIARFSRGERLGKKGGSFPKLAIVLLFLILLLPGRGIAASNPTLEACLVSATLKVFSDFPVGPASVQPFRITAVRNEYAPFQVALSSKKPMERVTIGLENPASETTVIGHPADRTFIVEMVTVERPSIPLPKAGWEKTFPVSWPDPLPPFKTFRLEEGRTRAVWFDLFVPSETPPGLYRGNVLVSTKDTALLKLPFEVEVHDITLPTTPSLRTAFGNASLQSCSEKAYGISGGSAAFKKLAEEYYWFLVEHRLSPYHIPVDIFSDDAHRFLDDPRVTSFVIPIAGGIGKTGNIWDDPKMKLLSDRIEKKGWIEKGFVYLIDEPAPDAIPEVIRVGKRIHAINPRLKYLMTPHSSHLLLDKNALEQAGIDIWAPILSVMAAPTERRVLLKEQRAGKELWWYTCVAPKWRGLNYFIDEAATAPRIHSWMNYFYGNDGILYWATDNWTDVGCNPWAKTETYPTGNGDGSLLYPSRDSFNHPVASIRLKMLREGLEDYELLKLLGIRLKDAALRIGGEAMDYRPQNRLFEHAFALVTDDGRSRFQADDAPYLKYLTRDYRDMERQRDLVMEEIERVAADPLLLVETTPCDKGYTSSGTATVAGYAETGSTIRINGNEVPLIQNRFDAVVSLAPGPNMIVVMAKNRAGRTKTFKRTVYKK